MSKLGRRIRDLRIAKGLSRPELAAKAGISAPYVWRIEESGAEGAGVRPSASSLLKIADVLETSVPHLLSERRGTVSVDQVTATKRGVLDIPELPKSLRDFISVCKKRKEPLTKEDVWMLAGINYRGKVPKNVKDWEYIWESIRRTIG